MRASIQTEKKIGLPKGVEGKARKTLAVTPTKPLLTSKVMVAPARAKNTVQALAIWKALCTTPVESLPPHLLPRGRFLLAELGRFGRESDPEVADSLQSIVRTKRIPPSVGPALMAILFEIRSLSLKLRVDSALPGESLLYQLLDMKAVEKEWESRRPG